MNGRPQPRACLRFGYDEYPVGIGLEALETFERFSGCAGLAARLTPAYVLALRAVAP
jgi:hypothetical protein